MIAKLNSSKGLIKLLKKKFQNPFNFTDNESFH